MKGLLLLLALGAGLGAAEDGGQPVAWTKLALGARAASLGQAVTALTGDVGSALLNPALAAAQGTADLGSQAALLPDGRQLHYLGLARPFWAGSAAAWTLGYAQYSVNEPYERRLGNTGAPDGQFRESASLSQLGLAAWIMEQRLAVGAGIKVYSHALGDASAAGASGDLGLLYRALPWLDAGLLARDALGRFGWSSGTGEALPMRLRAGLRLHREERHSLLLELDSPAQQAPRFRAGAETSFWGRRLALRLGFDGAQPSAGLGMRWPWRSLSTGFDYALAADPLGAGAFQHRVSLELGVPL